MTNLKAVQTAAQIHVGSLIKSPYMTMRVTEVTQKGVKGYDEKYFQKKGKKAEMIFSYETLLNPHYNKTLQIINE